MRNEVGESIIHSWLKHIKKCEIVDKNWVASKSWALEKRDDSQLITKIEKLASEDPRINISTKNINNSQVEIDLLGYSFTDNKLVVVESAFHTRGMNYSNGKNIEKVFLKLAKIGLVISRYFNGFSAEIIFTTPKINVSDIAKIQTLLFKLEQIFKESGMDYKFMFIGNEEFYKKIMLPIVNLNDNQLLTNDQGDFVRSLSMIRMGKQYIDIT